MAAIRAGIGRPLLDSARAESKRGGEGGEEKKKEKEGEKEKGKRGEKKRRGFLDQGRNFLCFPKEPAAGAASQKKKEEERKRRKGEKRERGKGERERREGKERRGREGKERGKGERERRRREEEGREEGKREGRERRRKRKRRGRRERKEKGERRKERRKEKGRKGERKGEGKRKEGKKGWWIIPRRCTAVTGGRLTTAYYCPKPRACRFRNNRAADECSRIVPSRLLLRGAIFCKTVPFLWWPKRVPGGRPLRARGGLYLSVLIGGSEICPLGVFS